MSIKPHPPKVRQVRARSLHLRVAAHSKTYDEDAGYPTSVYQTVIDDPDHDVVEYIDRIHLDGDHWTVDDATIEAIDFLAADAVAVLDPAVEHVNGVVPNHHEDPKIRRSLAAHATVLRAMTETLDKVHDAGGDVTGLLGRVPPDHVVDLAVITNAAAQEINRASSRPRSHNTHLPDPGARTSPPATASRPGPGL